MPTIRKNTRVLVVDDSALIRQIIGDFVSEAEGMELAGVARDGEDALQKIEKLVPDVVTLDVQMPKMDGLQTLNEILKRKPLPVIMVSALTQRSADVTLQALERGAMDYVAKPDGTAAIETRIKEELIHKIRTSAGADVERVLRIRKKRAAKLNAPSPARQPVVTSPTPVPSGYENSCVALGISTGGPPALSLLFQSLRPPVPPIVVVQHMPAEFTSAFAGRLDSLSQICVKEAATGDMLKPNHAYVAPGGRHLHLQRRGANTYAHIRDGEPVSGHRPSVDVMMSCAAKIYGARCLGIIMTGMGSDGADGCRQIRLAGGYVIGQDQASSDVYGMNRVAFVEGHVDRQFSLDNAANEITRCCKRFDSPAVAQRTLATT